MSVIEEASAQEILEEGSRYLGGAEMLRRTGRPEREIVQAAVEWQADVLVICSRSPPRWRAATWAEVGWACGTLCLGSCPLSSAAGPSAVWQHLPHATVGKAPFSETNGRA